MPSAHVHERAGDLLRRRLQTCAAGEEEAPALSPPHSPRSRRRTLTPPLNLDAAMPHFAAAAATATEAAAPDASEAEPPCDPETLARWYQQEALERALAGNTLAFLETGSGKTLIAVLLLRAYAHRIRSTQPPSFAVFLVPTVVLVGQQARVVQAHTDLRVAQFYGAMGVDFWDRDTWRARVDGAEVLVMTPQILLDNLRRSYFRLGDIPLLIFDECHNAVGDSPYASLLKEFYHPQLNSRPSDPIPRIFGMTASLINSKGLQRAKYSEKISELENLMHAKVYTVDSESALSQYIPFAETNTVEYNDSIITSVLYSHIVHCLNKLETKHLEILKGKLHVSSLEHEKRIKRLSAMFLYCISDLGVWSAAKAAEVLLSCKESCLSFWGEQLDEKVERLVRNYIEDDFAADLQDGLLTSKVHVLIEYLLKSRDKKDLRCIVFVNRVITSIVLESLLSTINPMSGWSIRHMAGKNSGLNHQSRNAHMEIIDSFREGKVNLIIATQILEEGLDVPSCNLVIRFDPSATVCSFIQGDANALSKTQEFLASGQIMREESLKLASINSQPLPNTLCKGECYVVQSTGAVVTLNSSVPLIYFFCSKLPSDEYFKPLPIFKIDKALGACTLHLPKSSPVQIVYAEGEIPVIKKVVCLKACQELHAIGALTDHLLPELSVPCEDEPDIGKEVRDRGERLRLGAQREGLRIMREIIQHHQIVLVTRNAEYRRGPQVTVNKIKDMSRMRSRKMKSNMMPQLARMTKMLISSPSTRNICATTKLSQSVAAGVAKWRCHVVEEMVVAKAADEVGDGEVEEVVDKYMEHPDYFPEQLVDNWLSFSRLGLYHCYKISLEGCCETTSPDEIVLAVKCDMGSDFLSNSFKLWGVKDYVNVTMRYVGIIHLNQEQVIAAIRFQTKILSLLIRNDHLEVEDSIKDLLGMQVCPGVYLLLPIVSGKIDWCSIYLSASPILEKGTRHCHSCKDIDLLQTKDGPFCQCTLQNSIVCTPHNGTFYVVSGFLDLNVNSLLHRSDGSVVSYKDHFKDRHGLNLTCEDLPLLAASKLVKVQNFLQKRNYNEVKESTNAVELPPELCRVVMSPVSANTLRSFTFIPSIMYRIQCLLLSVKLKIQLGPRMQQFEMPALKILEALTTKKCHEEFNQESLETLGDSFLKYITTQHLFSKYKHQHEGMLTKMKKNLISNAALCQLACSNNLVGYIRGEIFNPETWIIPGVGNDTDDCSKIFILSPNMYSLGNLSIKSKRIADSIEALIGAYLSASGELAAYLFLKSLGMDIVLHEMPVERKITFKSEEFINLRSLELTLDYRFKDHSLLLEALTHGSYQIAGTTACYQRLEFLGDGVLDYIFTYYFYREYCECTPQLLSDLRSASVNNSCYAHAAVKAGLHKHILHSSSALHKRMVDYLDKFEQSFSGPSHGWEPGIGLPKVLGDVIESIAGAIYIDSSHDKDVVWRSMKRLLEPLVTPDTLVVDPVTELQELCARKAYRVEYAVTHENSVPSVVAEVQTKGTTYKATRTGLTKLDAKKLAAKAVLQDMKSADGT
ncbi:hypothetical protein U9M48_009852 [Paspalum notatum var. saurae]|uniref:Uncharacterized protein n=1 Tax=Paspalum notatum var. saurae TaxID=547442 RepID=A0AAQ3SSN9_PASNO